MSIPRLTSEFVCIVNRDCPELAATISSYLHRNECYLPLFEFPVTTANNEGDPDEDDMDEHFISRSRSYEFNIHVHNVLHKLGDLQNLILAGLSPEQRSYLTFLGDYNVIEINSITDVDFALSGFSPHLTETVTCRPQQIHEGLYFAVKSGAKLSLDESAPDISILMEAETGLVVVERISAVSSIIALNYSLSIGASVLLVDPLSSGEKTQVLSLIEDWKNGADSSFNELNDKIQNRLSAIEITDFPFATFFTTGLPYSLGISNAVPCSYIHLLYRPDFFIFNSIFFESRSVLGSAVVFSPGAFPDEETNRVIEVLRRSFYFVRELLGESATTYNIDMHVKAYPYDIFHICSHGGQVDGYMVTEQFVDRDGLEHTVEYDEVVSFAKEPGEKLIGVTIKMLWRSFDGYKWKSKELKDLNYPHYVFTDMLKSVNKKNSEGKKQNRVVKENIPNSCAIKCHFSNYQGMFQMTADAVLAPIVFNNTCWSWSGIAESFLHGGVRGYVGTLWNINNTVAIDFANVFYDRLFDGTVLNAFHQAHTHTRGTRDENIYVYFGLHFSSLKRASDTARSRRNICETLMRSFFRWRAHSKTARPRAAVEGSTKLARWLSEQLRQYFLNE